MTEARLDQKEDDQNKKIKEQVQFMRVQALLSVTYSTITSRVNKKAEANPTCNINLAS